MIPLFRQRRSTGWLLVTLCALASSNGWAEPRADSSDPRSSFRETFDEKLAKGWQWIDEAQKDWRLTNGRLAIRTQPGGIFGDDDRGSNILLRELPQGDGPLCVEVDLFNQPEGLYENAGLLLYTDADNYAVVLKEAYPGVHDPPVVLQVVSEIDRTFQNEDQNLSFDRDTPVRLRMRIEQDTITGSYRKIGSEDRWLEIGTIRRPASGRPMIGVRTSYGVADADRWAEFDNFEIAGCPAVWRGEQALQSS